MTAEVLAACRGAIAAGATEIYVKDGHDSARNMLQDDFPDEVTLIRGWTNSPESIVAGIDESFDPAIFIGYHSGAGFNGNPAFPHHEHRQQLFSRSTENMQQNLT